MSLGTLLLAVWVLMMGFVQTGLIPIPSIILGIIAIIAGILLLLEGLSVYSVTIPRR